MFGYACYTERFAGDLKGVAKHLDHLEDLGVTYLHLMPLLQPREGDNDGGYAVQDYRAVRSDLGTTDDLRDLATTLREPGDQPGRRPGAQPRRPRARLGRGAPAPASRRTATTSTSSPTATRARRLRADAARGLPRLRARQLHLGRRPRRLGLDDVQRVAVGPQLGQPRGARASSPRSSSWLANLGVEVLRLDAIAFLWKRLGTSCQNQPEVHAITQALRAVDPDRRAGGRVQGRGDRGPARPRAVPRHRARTPAG